MGQGGCSKEGELLQQDPGCADSIWSTGCQADAVTALLGGRGVSWDFTRQM